MITETSVSLNSREACDSLTHKPSVNGETHMRTAVRQNLNARKRRGLATVYRIVLQNMHDLGVKLNAEQLEEFSEAMVWVREQTKEQRETAQ